MKNHNIISEMLNSTVFSLISEHLELKSCEQSWSMWRPRKLTDGFLKVLQTCLLTSRWNTSNSLTDRTKSQRIVGNAVMRGLEVNSSESDTRDFLKTYTQSLSLSVSRFLLWCCLINRTKPAALSCCSVLKNRDTESFKLYEQLPAAPSDT